LSAIADVVPDLGYLAFLAEPWFVVPWYLVGAAGAIWVVRDTHTANPGVGAAVAWAWPIIVFFFSVIGLALYRLASRPGGIDRVDGEDAKSEAFSSYVRPRFRKVTGSVIHCVGGDGLGIVTAMAFARILRVGFWYEFWFEYAVGYVFGWFIFQYKAMSMMAESTWQAIAMAGRAEFFSMLTVMAGMGAVMGFVTPLVVGHQPPPQTFAFWGFAALGMLAGFVLTYPMNWMLVAMGWKEGQR
jgi:hypothetical protein